MQKARPQSPRLTMNALTLHFSDADSEMRLRGEVFRSSNAVTLAVLGMLLAWHVVAASDPAYRLISSICATGSAGFLGLRWALHSMANQAQAHGLFAQVWSAILVGGHLLFIAGQRSNPKVVNPFEAACTACTWIMLITLQHLLMLPFAYKAATTGAILLAGYMAPGWSELDAHIGPGAEKAMLWAALSCGEIVGYLVERMLRQREIIYVSHAEIARVTRDAHMATLKAEVDCATETAARFKRSVE